MIAPVEEDSASDLMLDPVSGFLMDSAGNVHSQDVPKQPEQTDEVTQALAGLSKDEGH